MKVKSYKNQGKRDNNEDFYSIGEKTFIVCDGVGGRDKGEIASEFVASNLLNTIENSSVPVKEEILQLYIKNVQEELNEITNTDKQKVGMATTLAMFTKTDNSAFVAHIGDSRVYYIKPNQKTFWRTKDHSLVTELVEADIITEKDALTHPMRNRITRAIQANKDNKTVKAAITKFDNIEADDLIFICSDGVTESLTDENLLNILIQNDGIKNKLSSIESICASYSKDNNTGILIKIESKDAFISGDNTFTLSPIISETIDIDNEEIEIGTSADNGKNHEEIESENSDVLITESPKKSINIVQVDVEANNKSTMQASDDLEVDKPQSQNISSQNKNIEEDNKKSPQQKLIKNDDINKGSSKKNILFIFLFILGLSALAYWFYENYVVNPTTKIDLNSTVLPQNSNQKPQKSNVIKIDNSNESKAFNQAKQFNTIDAYNQYLRFYPSGSNANQAKSKITYLEKMENTDWQNAIKSKDFSKYINKYPNSKHSNEARQKLNEIEKINKENQAWNTAKQKNTVDSYKTFITNFPNGKNIDEAIKIINKLIEQTNAKNQKIKNKKIKVKKENTPLKIKGDGDEPQNETK